MHKDYAVLSNVNIFAIHIDFAMPAVFQISNFDLFLYTW